MTTIARIPTHADLLVTLHQPASDAEIARIRDGLRDFGYRAIIVRADDVTITPLVRPARHAYPLSILAHVGR